MRHEITSKVLAQKDDLTPDHVIDHILNVASYKGTGNWMLEDGVALGAPVTVVAEAVMARFMSKQAHLAIEKGVKPTKFEYNGEIPDDMVENKFLSREWIEMSSILSFAGPRFTTKRLTLAGI